MAAKPKEERAPVRQMSSHPAEGMSSTPPRFSLAEVRQLIALMNTSDLNEITIERPADGMRLALRKTMVEVSVGMNGASVAVPAAALVAAPSVAVAPSPAPVVPEYDYVTAPLVGTFHPAFKVGQKPLVAVGDTVREGQLIGGIETLRVMNEVEAHMNGRVMEILVQPGQPVEYGQRLIALAPDAR